MMKADPTTEKTDVVRVATSIARSFPAGNGSVGYVAMLVFKGAVGN